MKKIIYLILPLMLNGCVGSDKYQTAQNENETLKLQIDSLNSELNAYKNSPSKLLQEVLSSIKEDNDSLAYEKHEAIKRYHPESEEFTEANNAYLTYSNAKKEALEKAEKERLGALNRLKKNYDDVSGITWYENPYYTHYENKNLTSIYIAKNNSKIWLRLKMSYAGEDWIFFKNAYLSYDGNTIEIPFDEYKDKKSENDSGVWEWIDVTASDDLIVFLRQMIDSENPKMRLSGKYTETRKLSPNEVKGIKDVLAGYDILKSSDN